MAEYLVIHTNAEGADMKEVHAKSLGEVSSLVPSLFSVKDGDDIDIFRTTSHKQFQVKIETVTSLT